MAMGLAGALLVFTGIWHAFEWAMGGRNPDTARLVMPGIIYLGLGYLIVTGTLMPWAAWVALVLAALGAAVAYSSRNRAEIRKWVSWAFILIDVIVVVALGMALLA